MKSIIIAGLILISCLSDDVPCTISEASTLATVSDCSAHRDDQYTLEWGVRITFKNEA